MASGKRNKLEFRRVEVADDLEMEEFKRKCEDKRDGKQRTWRRSRLRRRRYRS